MWLISTTNLEETAGKLQNCWNISSVSIDHIIVQNVYVNKIVLKVYVHMSAFVA